jgi:quercetin dioxygenase-like cupin family protein
MELIDLTQEREHEPVPGYRVRFVHSENMTFAFWDIKKGYEVPLHAHPNEQVVKMIEGKLELRIDGQKHVMEPGLVMIIPAGVEHSAYSLTDCKAIDTFYPVREDYKNL